MAQISNEFDYWLYSPEKDTVLENSADETVNNWWRSNHISTRVGTPYRPGPDPQALTYPPCGGAGQAIDKIALGLRSKVLNYADKILNLKILSATVKSKPQLKQLNKLYCISERGINLQTNCAWVLQSAARQNPAEQPPVLLSQTWMQSPWPGVVPLGK